MAVELDTTTAQEPREVSQRTLNRRLKATARQEFAAWDGKVEDDNCVPDAAKYGRDLAPLLRLSLVFMYRDKAQMIEACRGLDAMPREGGGTMLDAVQADIDHVAEFATAMQLLTEGAKARLLVACAAIAVERGMKL